MASPQGITREQARAIAANAVLRNGSYDPTDASNVARLDMAIDAAFMEFCNRVCCDIVSDTSITIPAGSTSVDLSTIAGFDVDRLLKMGVITGGSIYFQCMLVDASVVEQARNSSSIIMSNFPFFTGIVPNASGIDAFALVAVSPDRTTLQIYPKFQENMTVRIEYWKQFNAAAAGTGTKFNVPYEFCYGICYWGVPLYYDFTQDGGKADRCRQEFDNLILRSKNATPSNLLQVRPHFA
jgi:hypothetical protein